MFITSTSKESRESKFFRYGSALLLGFPIACGILLFVPASDLLLQLAIAIFIFVVSSLAASRILIRYQNSAVLHYMFYALVVTDGTLTAGTVFLFTEAVHTVAVGRTFGRYNGPFGGGEGGGGGDTRLWDCKTFPLLVPEPSAHYVIPREVVVGSLASVRAPTIDDVADRLNRALDLKGYTDRRYFCLEENQQFVGLALATRIEQVNEDGTPKSGSSRWAETPTADSVFDVILGRLLFPRRGYFRIIVFFMTDRPVRSSGVISERNQMESLYRSGHLISPRVHMPYSDSTEVVAIVYEFDQTATVVPQVKVPGRWSGRDHLARAGIALLDRPQ